MPTRTGNFPIGFRRGWTDWQRDVPSLAAWAREIGFDALDVPVATPADVKTIANIGLKMGPVDLLDLGDIMATDLSKRKDVLQKNLAYIKDLGAAGVKLFFSVVIPGDHAAKRADNYKLAVECYAPLAQAAHAVGGSIILEGWPGGPPNYSSLCCTPETIRAILKDIPRGMALNYDPSHLIRLGVDHYRFLQEFISHVRHVHAKDTAVYPEAQYELGTQGSSFASGHGFGEYTWRYTIPGHGIARWPDIFALLKSTNYPGLVSVELEDENFNGTEAGEKAALLHSLNYLRGA
jgi:sugar phosphate isomerase/epimerase